MSHLSTVLVVDAPAVTVYDRFRELAETAARAEPTGTDHAEQAVLAGRVATP